METEFTPLASSFGGILIGVAATLLMALYGRIAGASGILAGALLRQSPGDGEWRIAFLIGMITAPLAYFSFSGTIPPLTVPTSMASLVIGGVIVGIGVRLGSGCTSGHGVCGNARLSRRSIVATLTFMATTALTVFFIRHVLWS